MPPTERTPSPPHRHAARPRRSAWLDSVRRDVGATPGTSSRWSDRGTRLAARAGDLVPSGAGDLVPSGVALAGGVVVGVLRDSWPATAAGAVTAGVLLWRAARRCRQRSVEARRGEIAALIDGVRSGVRAGLPADTALVQAWQDCPGLAPRPDGRPAGGEDVLWALEQAAGRPGGEGLRAFAVCWRLVRDQGTCLAAALDRMAGSLRAEAARRAGVEAEAAGCRATIRMLVTLPLLPLLLGPGLGSDPVRWLVATPTGWVCLVTGVTAQAAGAWWARRIIRAAGGAP